MKTQIKRAESGICKLIDGFKQKQQQRMIKWLPIK